MDVAPLMLSSCELGQPKRGQRDFYRSRPNQHPRRRRHPEPGRPEPGARRASAVVTSPDQLTVAPAEVVAQGMPGWA